MNNSFKRRIAAAMAVAVMVLSATTAVFAASTAAPATSRPRPGSDGSTTTTTQSTTTKTTSGTSATDDTSTKSSSKTSSSDSDDDTSTKSSSKTSSSDSDEDSATTTKTKTTTPPEPTTVVETAAPQTSSNSGGGIGFGGMFVWFIITVIVNGIISFAIGNRFYKLSKKESHVTSEIRALRRDVEEKFVNNVGGFAESEVDITNSNGDYSLDSEGIKMTPVSTQPRTAEADDMFKKWEEQRAQRRAALKRTVETVPEFDDEDDTRVYTKKTKKKYQPRRTYAEDLDEIEEDDDDLYEEDTKESGLNTVKNKAKEFIGGIFPFKED